MGILIKISSISTIIVILTVVVLSITSIITMRSVSLQTAVIMGKEKITGDIESFKLMIKDEHGDLRLQDGDLVDQDDVLSRFKVIDEGVKSVSTHELNIRNAMEEQEVGGKQILESMGRLIIYVNLSKKPNCWLQWQKY